VGRLFWKFFAFCWLAQLAGIFAIAAVFWLTQPRFPDERGAPTRAGILEGSSPRGPGNRPPDRRPPPNLLHVRGLPPPAPTIATLLASLASALGLAWYVARPIRSLRMAFDAAANGNLHLRVAPLIGNRHDELADLGRDFDRMADRLQASMSGQRRLLHDVSHEMRSPLARLQAATGLLRLKQGQDSTVERIEEEIVRIDRLVGALLTLSRLEAGEFAEAEESVDLQELVREVVADANFEAQTTGQTVIGNYGTAAQVAGRPEMLRAAIENVVRNALKHAPNGPQVVVETALNAARTHYTLRVLDTGPGVPERDLARLFTPFFRAADTAHSDGYGLGLAIARRSVEAHGGTIAASNRPEGGLVVAIVLPV
jgi:two-component system OmpR family sensor kinase